MASCLEDTSIPDRVGNLLQHYRYLIVTAKGRADVLKMLDEWEDCFYDYELARCIDVMTTVRHLLRNAFVVSAGGVVEPCGQPDEEEFNAWRRM
jgi:hypothetical protein